MLYIRIIPVCQVILYLLICLVHSKIQNDIADRYLLRLVLQEQAVGWRAGGRVAWLSRRGLAGSDTKESALQRCTGAGSHCARTMAAEQFHAPFAAQQNQIKTRKTHAGSLRKLPHSILS